MRYTDIIKKAKNVLLDVIFPRRCIVCDRPLNVSEYGACKACMSSVRKIRAPYCMKCGKQLKYDDEIYCKDCQNRTHVYEEGRSLFLYDDAMKRCMYRFKYNGRREYADYFAEEISVCLQDYIERICPDVLIPIPIHKKRLKKRGYNQASLLALSLGKRVKIPVLNGFLIRTDETAKQKNLNVFERQNNLKKAFKTTQNDVKYSSAILIDDIYTTGATIDAAAAVLKEAGFKKIYFMCVCSGRNT